VRGYRKQVVFSRVYVGRNNGNGGEKMTFKLSIQQLAAEGRKKKDKNGKTQGRRIFRNEKGFKNSLIWSLFQSGL
jgi:hypothetical protein